MYNIQGDPRCYRGILYRSRPVSPFRHPMSRLNRAAQFAPFDALTGFGAAIREMARRTEAQRELTEDQKAALNAQLLRLRVGSDVTVCYFLPDERKDGGAYLRVTGTVRKLDSHTRCLQFTDGTMIPIKQLHQLELHEPEFFF